jgi:outer membrane PBP1 activator LpoA protein
VTPTIKGSLLLGALTLFGTVVRMMLQAKQSREMAAAKLLADAELAKLRQESEERAARHAKDAAERAAERDQKEKLFQALQDQSARTLAILETELKVTQETTNRAFDLLQKNTETTAELARGLALTNAKIDGLANGAGCRARASN